MQNKKIKTEHGGSNPKLHYATITGKNSLTRVALLEEILHICSNNKLNKSRNQPKTPPQIAGKLKLHPSSPIVSQKRRNSIYSRIGRLPVVSARIIPARRPLKSRNTFSTVLGLYPGSIRSAGFPDSYRCRRRFAASDVFPGGVFERRV